MVEEVARLLSQARGAYQREQYQVALAYFQQACQVDSHSPEALLGMGEVSSFLGFRDQAVAAFLSLADLYLRAAMLEVAAEVIERIVDLDPYNAIALRFQRYIAGRLRPRTHEMASVVTAIERPRPLPSNRRPTSEVEDANLERWDRADTSAPTNVQSTDNELDELIGDISIEHQIEHQIERQPRRQPASTIAFADTQIARTPAAVAGPARSRYSVTLTGVEEPDETGTLTPVVEADFEVITRTFEAAEITALDPEPVEKMSVIFDFGDELEDPESFTDLGSEPEPERPAVADIQLEGQSSRPEDDLFGDVSTRAAPRGMLEAIARADDDPFSGDTVVAGDLPRLLARRTDPKFAIDIDDDGDPFDDEDDQLIEVITTRPDPDDGEFDVLTEAEDPDLEPGPPPIEVVEEDDDFDRDTVVAGDPPELVAGRADSFAADTEVVPLSPALLAAMGTGAHRTNSWEANTEAAVMAENFRDRPAISIDAATEELDLSDFPSYEEAEAAASRVTATITLDEADAVVMLEELAPISPLIGQLGADGRQRLLGVASVLQCFAGQVICHEGEAGQDLYLLLSGQAAVERTPPGSSSPQRIASLSPGAFFGEGSVLADAPRSSTVRIIDDALLIEIEREALQELVKQRPHLLTILTRFLRARLVSSMMMSSPMFLRLDMTERTALAPLLHVHKLNAGQQVVRRGQLLTGYCTVMAGELERADLADGTGKQVAGRLRVGDSFGTNCLDGHPSPESIGAVTGCWLVRLPTENLRQLCDSHPGMLEALSASDVLA